MKKIMSSMLAGVLCMVSVLVYLPAQTAHAGSYDAGKAVEYARTYWSNYNPAYRNYNGSGGDCANFVSQCLYAGGLQQDGVWYNGSGAWIGCNPQLRHFQELGYQVIDYAQASDIKPGNPIYYYNGGTITHTAICVGYDSKGTPLVAAHNNNHWNYEWTLGGPSWWGGSSRRVTVLITNGSSGGQECGCSESYAGDYIVSTSSYPLIMRSGHGTGYSIVTQIPKGSTVHVSKADGTWAHVEWNGYSGFCSMQYLTRQQSAKAPNLRVWFTDSVVPGQSMGAPIGSDKFKFAGWYYLCYELTDPDTGRKFTENSNYTVKETVYRPDGSIKHSYSYERSTDNWIGFQADASGTFKGVVEISGDYIGSSTITITAPDASGVGLDGWFSETKMGTATKELEKGKLYYFCYELKQKGTGKRLSEVMVLDYTMKEEVRDPNGNTVGSFSYINSDGNCIGFRPSITGTYTGYATMTGGYQMNINRSAVCKEKTVSVTSVSLSSTALGMTEGQKWTLTATVSPSNATDKSVKWSSSDTSVATVKDGVVTAVKKGNATITATTTDGAKKATCNVTVSAKTVSVTGVSLSNTDMTLTEGEKKTLTATVSPSNATDKSVKWSSSDTSVATVKDGVVTAVKKGNATITATTIDGSRTARCTVQVISMEKNVEKEVKAKFVVEDVSARAGSEVTVNISIKENPGITALKLMMDYPEDKLELKNVEYPELFSSRGTGGNRYQSPFVMTWFSANSKNETANGVFAKVTFKVKDGVKSGSYEIGLKYDADNVIDIDGDQVDFRTENGKITIYDSTPGDINGDKLVNMKDIVVMQQRLNGWDVAIDESAADVNKDGKFNMKDIVLLQQYLNGWDVDLK